MRVRITRGTFDPAVDEEQLTALTQGIADAIKTQAGFVSFLSGMDRQTGTFVAISTWQDQESANFPREALGPVMSQVVDLGVRMDPPEMYEMGPSV